MMNTYTNNLCQTFLPVLLLAALSYLARAEIATDGTLGVATTLSGPDFSIAADLGQQRGANLFHSFSQFNITANDSATFTGPANIANIISRITGGDASTINGALKSEIAGANLFLLNPAGILFGPNATLDISGSLYVSSADYLALGGNLEKFFATPQQNEILTVAAPIAFGFLGSDTGAIKMEGTRLTLDQGSTLTLVANGIELDTAKVEINRGSVQMTSLAASAEVSIVDGEISTAGQATPDYGDISLVNQSDITVGGEGGGRVLMQGGHIQFSESIVEADTLGSSDGMGISIKAVTMALSDGGFISSSTFGEGDAGNITMQIADKLEVIGNGSQLSTVVVSEAFGGSSGNAGAIEIDATTLELSNGAAISSGTVGTGDAGNITVQATDLLHISGGDAGVLTGIFSNAVSGSSGNAGAIDIGAANIELLDGAAISSSASATGDAGNITIEAIDRLQITGDGSSPTDAIISKTLAGSSGNAGDIAIDATIFELSNGRLIGNSSSGTGDAGTINIKAFTMDLLNNGVISNDTFSEGNAGKIAIEVAGNTNLQDSQISSSVAGTGAGGTVVLNSGSLSLNQSNIFTVAREDGLSAGSVTLDVTGDVHLDNESAISTATEGGSDTDNPAFINIMAGNLILNDDSFISTEAFGAASAGDIDLTIADSVQILGGSQLATEANEGGGGRINLSTRQLLYLRDSSVTTSVVKEESDSTLITNGSTDSTGGDVGVNSPFIVLDNSEIIANNEIIGDAGNITLSGDYIYESTDTVIEASALVGRDGDINRDAFAVRVDAGENSLVSNFLDASEWVRQACRLRSGNSISHFIIQQRPLRPSPNDAWTANPVDF